VHVAMLSRYPRVDTPAWKRALAGALLEAGADVTILYARSSVPDQLRAGLKEFGAAGMLAKYRGARRGRSVGSGENGTLASWGEKHGIPVIRLGSLSDPRFEAALRRAAPDLVVLAGADIVPSALLAVPSLGTINPHYALLPRYRGMNVAEWSIYHDDSVGVSVHFVDPGIDTGDIVLRAELTVEHGDTLDRIRRKQQELSARLLFDAATAIQAGRARRTPQAPHEGRQYYRLHPLLLRRVEDKLVTGSYSRLGANPQFDLGRTLPAR
jgi:folate-dependent phosphoribosylglycinamide formyltransferase PurN